MCRTANSEQSFASNTQRRLRAPSTVESVSSGGGMNIPKY
jgi:hypothetical protein